MWVNFNIEPFMSRKEYTKISFFEAYANTCYLKEFIHRITEGNRVLFINLMSDWTGYEGEDQHAARTEREINDMYSNIVIQEGGTVISFVKTNNFEFEPVTETERHPSKNTHEQYAKTLFQELVGNPVWGFIINDI